MAEEKTTPITKETETTPDEAVSKSTVATNNDSTAAAPAPTPRKKKSKRPVPHGQVHVLATFNNTIITFTDNNGGALAAASAGGCGFRGSKKGTAYAAQIAAEKAGRTAVAMHGIRKADVFVKGIGLGRDAAVRALHGLDIGIETLTDVTGIPHGGCRPRKARRV